MGKACNTNGEEEECIYAVGWKARGKETSGKTKMLMDNIMMDFGEI
jgi:hypothetical protein